GGTGGELWGEENGEKLGGVVQASAEPAGGEPVPDRDVADLGGRDIADVRAVVGRERGGRRLVEGEDRHHHDRQVQEGVDQHGPCGEAVLGVDAPSHRSSPPSWRTGCTRRRTPTRPPSARSTVPSRTAGSAPG